tara:strand:- start:1137 stop:1595 length:459 start_codon:yes stop_codon:yes gene_type:complete
METPDLDDPLTQSLIQAFLAQMDSAMRVSDILAKHDKSDEIKVDHLIGGLVYRLMVPMTQQQLTESLDSAREIVDHLDSEDSEDFEGEYDTIEDYPEPLNRKIRPPTCNCDICSKLRVCLLNYSEYECTDPLAEKFKKSIDSTCEQHGILLS